MDHATETIRQTKSIPSLFADLMRETTDLVRGEVRLAKAEFSEKVTQVETGMISLAIGAVVSVAGILILLEAAVLGLATVMPAWLSALIIGGIALIIGLILFAVARNKFRAQSLAPHATMESLRRDQRMIREQMP